MGIVVDVILVLIVLSFIGVGYKKGLTGSLIRLLSFAIAIVITLILYKPISSIVVSKTNIDDNIKRSIIATFNSEKENPSTEETKDEKTNNKLISEINTNIQNATIETKNRVIEQSADKITKIIINIGVGIAIFLIARIILSIISIFIKGLTKLPIIKQIDKIGGIVYGLVEGLLVIYVVFGIISFATIVWPNNITSKPIEESYIGSTLYNNNVVMNVIFK